MKKSVKNAGYIVLFSLALAVACKKNDAEPTPDADVDHSKDSVELMAAGKGFKKVYGYLEARGALYYPGTINEIHGVDLTVEGADKVNFAFSLSGGSQQGTVKTMQRATANYLTQTTISAASNFSYSNPTGSDWQELGFSYVPFTNKLAYMYYMNAGTGYVTGDVKELSGQSLLTTDRRIAKMGHSVYSVTGSQGQNSPTQTNGFTYAYYNTEGNFIQFSSSDGTFTGIQFPLRASSQYVGVFEPIPATNEGIVALYNKDSVTVYLNNLTTPAVKFTRVTKSVLTATMALSGRSIVKNNANDNNFSFACIEGSRVWTFMYNTVDKSLTKVLDGAFIPSTAKSIDIDENGAIYYFAGNSVFKQDAVNGIVTLAKDILSAGNLSVLKCYNGKVFLLAERFKNDDGSQGRRQLDVLVSE